MKNEKIKSPRINIELDESNHAYLKTLSGATGKNLTILVNSIIGVFIADHPEILKRAGELEKSIEKVLPPMKAIWDFSFFCRFLSEKFVNSFEPVFPFLWKNCRKSRFIACIKTFTKVFFRRLFLFSKTSKKIRFDI